MTLTDIHAPKVEPKRDRWGRPLITPANGGRPTGFQRVTTFAGMAEDRYGLEGWQQRMVALGLVVREDLLLAVAAHRDNKDMLNDVCKQAMEAAKASSGAVTGTALHALSDQLDRGQLDLGTVPASHRADLEAFAEATSCLQVEAIEVFGVHDDLEVAGTADRIYRYMSRLYIGDTKSGNIEFGQQKIATQLAVYSRMTLYDVGTNTRGVDLSKVVDQRRAIVVHLPAGTGRAELRWVDIHAGWKSVEVNRAVRDWRKAKDLLTPFERVQPVEQSAPADALSLAIVAAQDITALDAIWATHKAAWTDVHTGLARTRKAALNGAGGTDV